MKEFVSEPGGRYTYTDDFINLQDLALAMTGIFDGCQNFVVHGCEINGNAMSSGLVYLNGKLRVVAATDNLPTKRPLYIIEDNSIVNLPYVSSEDKAARHHYGTKIGTALSNENIALTNAIAQYIAFDKNNQCVRMKDAWLGKYGVILNPSAQEQTVNSNVNIAKNLKAASSQVEGDLKIGKNGKFLKTYWAEDKIVIEGGESDDRLVKWIIDAATGSFAYEINGIKGAEFTQTGARFYNPIKSPSLVVDGVSVTSNRIYNHADASDTGVVSINLQGYSGGAQFFRNTVIGNGKSGEMLRCVGRLNEIKVNSKLTFDTNVQDNGCIQFTSSLLRNDPAFKSYMKWSTTHPSVTANQSELARIGFVDLTSTALTIENKIGKIALKTGDNPVVLDGRLEVGRDIKEAGVYLAEKYVSKNAFNLEFSKACLRDEVQLNYVRKDTILDDIIGTTNSASRILDHLGFQKYVWAFLEGVSFNFASAGYACQIGVFVNIHGRIEVNSLNVGDALFRLPESISLPLVNVPHTLTCYAGSGIKKPFESKPESELGLIKCRFDEESRNFNIFEMDNYIKTSTLTHNYCYINIHYNSNLVS